GTVEYPSAQTVGKYTIRFTPTANDTRLAIPPGMAISELSVEAADTYDAAVGGFRASSPATPCHATDAAHRDGGAR
ncbi:hypothetical protein, partial [Bifidobacterium adolescentis]|uniref:hypothetical protein n=1 Tax=Bifidobacterium adolescentis TaxID=1680 RepID=UPI00398CC576